MKSASATESLSRASPAGPGRALARARGGPVTSTTHDFTPPPVVLRAYSISPSNPLAFSGTKMVDAMAHGVTAVIPDALGPYLAPITGLLSIPFTFFISNDAFYYGVVPILAESAGKFGISRAEIGRASLIGQPVHLLSPLVPSTYLLVGLAEVELGDHQRFTLKWSAITALVLLAAGVVTAVIPWAG